LIDGARHDARYVVDHLLGRETSADAGAANRRLVA
jgi:hypothetical protein